MVIVYDFDDYKDFLGACISDPKSGRGFHSKLARASGCQSSFLSQVLHSHVHLTSDHIAGISDFLALDEDEHTYLQALLTLARSSAPRLIRTCRTQIEELRRKHRDISSRVNASRIDYGSDEATYYSAWYYTAIHVLISISGYGSSKAICERLGLPKILVDECLGRLNKMGLIERKDHGWAVTRNHLHLSKDALSLNTHHTNWRIQATLKAALRDPDALQYSVVTAVSRNDAQKLRNMLLDFIENSRAIITPSPEEELIYIGLDCFKVG